MIIAEIVGSDALSRRLLAMSGRARTAAKSSLDAWAKELAAYIKASKLSGDPLYRRSGRLSSSIHGYSTESADVITGAVGGGAGVPYAQIHEFGGRIPARVAHGRAMAIKLAGGQVIFRKSARGFDMPERSYMRSAFEEKAPDGMAQLREAVLGAIGGAQ